jgi:DNA-binding MarR family transcriptional regulator
VAKATPTPYAARFPGVDLAAAISVAFVTPSRTARGCGVCSTCGSELTPRQYIILQAVAAADGLSQTDIMAATGIDRSSIADLAKRLVAHGWLRRRRTKRDARAYSVRLTPEGRRMLAVGIPAARVVEEMFLVSLPKAQRQVFVNALRALAYGEEARA